MVAIALLKEVVGSEVHNDRQQHAIPHGLRCGQANEYPIPDIARSTEDRKDNHPP